MKNLLILLFLFTALSGCKFAKTNFHMHSCQFDNAIKSIFDHHLSKKSMSYEGEKFFIEIIKQVEAIKKLDTVEVNELYIIESFNIEDGRTRGSIFLNNMQIHYEHFNKKIEFEQQSYFPKSLERV